MTEMVSSLEGEDEELLYFKKSEKVFPPVHIVAGSGSVPVHASQG